MSTYVKKILGQSLYLKEWVRAGIIVMAVVAAVLFGGSSDYAKAAEIKIKYDGKKQTYTGSQTQVTLDGKKVDIGSEFGIIMDNTCMVPGEQVFADGLGASYSKRKKTITIEKHNITITMKIGSKTAYVNGEEKELDVAPKKIKFFDPTKKRFYVPARFVAENLGYTYVWNNTTRTSEMVSPMKMKYDAPTSEWVYYLGIKANIAYNGINIKMTDMPAVFLDDILLVQAEKVLKETMGVEYLYNEEEGSITIKRNDNTIIMYLNSKTAFVNGMSYTLEIAPKLIFPENSAVGYVMLPVEFTAKQLGYTYSWNSGTKTAFINRVDCDYTSLKWDELLMINSEHDNMITDITVAHKNKLDIISITGVQAFTPVIAEESTGQELQVEISDVYNQVSSIQKSFTDGIFVNGITVNPSEAGISITVARNTHGKYYTSQSGNTFQIIFCEDGLTELDHSTYQMKLVLPKGVSFKSIKHEDKYHEKAFVLTLEGDQRAHFKENPILYNSSVISKVTLSLNGSGNTEIRVDTHKIQGYKLNDCNDYVGINVANPSQVYDKIVVLDAGHGGKDPGALNSAAKEKDLALTIIYKFAKDYFNSTGSAIKAYWTRSDDTYVALGDRAAFASQVEADLFISLHMNAASAETAKGLEVLYGSNNKFTMSGLNSKEMAAIFKKQLIEDLAMTDRGIKDRPNLVVLKSNEVPAVLIELGFITNSEDLKKLTTESFQKKTAASIYEATKLCFEKYPTKR